MLTKLRGHLSFANVVSVLALFVALGGSAYAVTQLDRNSVKSKHIVPNKVKGSDVKEESLKIPRLHLFATTNSSSASGDVIQEQIDCPDGYAVTGGGYSKHPGVPAPDFNYSPFGHPESWYVAGTATGAGQFYELTAICQRGDTTLYP